jgi:hypothetical protein
MKAGRPVHRAGHRTHPVRVAFLTAAAVAAATAIGLVGGRVADRPRTVPVAEDVSVRDFAPASLDQPGEPVTPERLAAGGWDGGGAVSYLKFRVDLPADTPPAHAELWLARHSGRLPGIVELSVVPWADWQASRVTAGSAPRLGRVVGSVYTTGFEAAVHFDVTNVIRSSGEYAFAVTAPTSDSIGLFVSQENQVRRPPTLTLQWNDGPHPSASPLRPSPGRLIVAPSSTSLRFLQLPGWLPDEAAPYWLPSTGDFTGNGVSPEPGATEEPSPPSLPSPTSALPGSPAPSASPSPSGSPSESPRASPSASSGPSEPDCHLGALAVPSCGVLWGVAPGAHTRINRTVALRTFEILTERPQAVYHAYHRGDEMFPTDEEIRLARDPRNPRMLMLNWKPLNASWRAIAQGDRRADDYLDRLAAHIKATFPEPFFFTMHHEPEDDVRTNPRFGMTARDYAAAFRYVVQRLRADGVTNLISVVCFMAYIPWNTKPWFTELYPGDDVVDWVAWDAYAYSDPGYGYGDFAEMMNRKSSKQPDWPGFYTWAAQHFPSKPLMVAEWGVWHSAMNRRHPAEFYRSVGRQIDLFPRVKAMIYFETPSNQAGRDSRVHLTPDGLAAYRDLGRLPIFRVEPPVEAATPPSEPVTPSCDAVEPSSEPVTPRSGLVRLPGG